MKSKTEKKTSFIIGILLLCICLLGALGFITMKASVSANAQEALPSDIYRDGDDLLELTEEQCIDFVHSKGIDIPREFLGQSDIGGFIKSIIVSCVENPTCAFHYNYSVTQNFVDDIQAAVNEYYDRDFDYEASTVAASVSYTLQDSEVVSDENVDYYNCYAYAIGRTEAWYNPGEFSGVTLDLTKSISEIAQLVKKDLNVLGYYDVVVSADKPEVDSEAKLICVRKNNDNRDYHFMKYENGSWYHKPSNAAILRYKYDADYADWTNEAYHNGTYYAPTITYDSEIYYIRYYTEKPSYYDLFDGGVGSIQNPFLIGNATQFSNIGLAYRSVYIPRQGTENRITFAFKLTKSITISSDWIPFEYKFAGDFDGAGYYITYNMNLTQTDIDTSKYQGLFGFVVSEGNIHDLELKNCTITSTGTTLVRADKSFVNIGIVAGAFFESSGLTNVTVTNPKIECRIGNAVIGAITGSFYYCNAYNCVVQKQDNETSSITNDANSYIGGMAGLADSVSQFRGGSVTISLTNTVFDDEKDKMGEVISNVDSLSVSEYKEQYNITVNVEMNKKRCLDAGSLITLADGTQKPVEALTGDEMLLVWNLYTGQFDVAPILFIDRDAMQNYSIINLSFSNGETVKVISEHGFWNYNLNRYVYLDNNAAQYIGHWFYSQTTDEYGNMVAERVQLLDVTMTREMTIAYSPVTYGHLCYFVNGMLSMPGGIEGLFNIFEVDAETMSYDRDLMQTDIERYGLFTYEEFAELVPVSEEVFTAFNGQYLKVAIGKGIIDIDALESLVSRYAEFL